MSKPAQVPDELRFLLDNNLSPTIVPRLWQEAGVDSVHLRDRARVRMPDHEVLSYAEQEGRIVATINVHDFERLVRRKTSHPGIAVMPSGGSRDEQFLYLLTIINHLRLAPTPFRRSWITLFRSTNLWRFLRG